MLLRNGSDTIGLRMLTMSRLITLDHQWSAALRGKPPVLRPFMYFLTTIGRPALTMPTAVIVGLLHWQANRPVSYALAVGCSVMLVDALALKNIIGRQRPDTPYVQNMWPTTHSFPSGHAVGASILYGIWGYILAQHIQGIGHMIVLCGTVTLVLLISYSRLYVGAHYILDVLGGLIIGGTTALILIGTFL